MNGACPNTPAAPAREYTASECVYAGICLLAGYLFCRIFPVTVHPLGGLFFGIGIFLATFFMLRSRGGRLNIQAAAAAFSAVALLLALFLTDNDFMQLLAYGYAAVAYCYFVSAMTGNTLSPGWGRLLPDVFRAVFVLPFYSFSRLFEAFRGLRRSRLRVVLYVLLGLALALVPTLIVGLLLSYDDGFRRILETMFRWDFESVVLRFLSAAFGIPIGMYLFGAYLSSVEHCCGGQDAVQRCDRAVGAMRVLPGTAAAAACLPVFLLYVLFFASQWKYFVSGFAGILPDNATYAAYARSGFFELCAVAGINFLLLLGVTLFMRRTRPGQQLLLKIICLVFSGTTLLLLSTAAAKLVMYIRRFGLTPLRLYAAFLMTVLAIAFLLIAVRQFCRRLQPFPILLVCVLVLFSALSFGKTDGVIARYNVDRYLNGTLSEVDTEALEVLGDAAIPQLLRLGDKLADEIGENFGEEVRRRLECCGDDETPGEDPEPEADEALAAEEAASRTRAVSEKRALYEKTVRTTVRMVVIHRQKRSFFSVTLPYLQARQALYAAEIFR